MEDKLLGKAMCYDKLTSGTSRETSIAEGTEDGFKGA